MKNKILKDLSELSLGKQDFMINPQDKTSRQEKVRSFEERKKKIQDYFTEQNIENNLDNNAKILIWQLVQKDPK